MNATDIKSSIVKLSNGNYQVWKFKAEMILIKDDLWEVIEEDIPSEPTSAWLRKNNKARATIGLLIEDDQLTHIRQLDRAKDIWEALRKIHERGNLCSKLFLLRKLYGKRLERGQLMRDHVSAMTGILDQLRALGEDIKDSHAAALLLCSLPDSYSTLITALEARPESDLTFEFIRGKLLDEYERRCENDTASHSETTALGITNRNPRFTRELRTCYFCGKNGHLKKDCLSFKAQKNKTHRAKTVAGPTSGDSATFRNAEDETDEESDNNYCFSTCVNRKISKWYVDSGATNHMSSDRSFFTILEEFRDPLNIYLADGNVVKAQGRGEGWLMCNISGKSFKVRVKNVLFVPSLEGSLLSVKTLAKANYVTKFKGNTCEISKNDKIIAKAKMDSLLYKLDVSEINDVAGIVRQSHEHIDCLHLWHRRLGHRDPRAIEKMQRNELVTGMNISRCEQTINCVECIKGKTTNRPFPKSSKSRATAPFQLIHSDVCGPMKTPTHQGKKYILNIIDDYSRYSELYLMRNKNEAEGFIKDYIEKYKNKFNRMLQMIRTDGGGEFISNEFNEYLKSKGIGRQITIPHTPQQNGVAERKNRTLVETARCMLLDAKLDHSYWGEAVTTANYIQNRVLHNSCAVTPYQLWTSSVPDVSHLRVFGCEAHALIPKNCRQKFDSTTQEGILMGYSEESKGYRILIKETKRIIMSRTVKFIENANTNIVDNTNTEEKLKEQEVSILPDAINNEITVMKPEETRRISPRMNKGIPALKYGYRMTVEPNTEPDSWEEVLKLPEPIKNKWIEAMNIEMKAMEDNNAWDLTTLPKNKTTIASRWVFKCKEPKSGEEPIYRARLVAKGFLQRPGEDFDIVFAPVTRYTTVRLMLAIAAGTGMKSRHFDAKTAFLQGDLEEEIYMNQPSGHIEIGKENMVCRLRKSIYGLKQSARVWNNKINEALLAFGFQRGEADNCLYTKKTNGSRVYVIIYVDDILAYADNYKELEALKENLETTFSIKDLGPVSSYLGIDIDETEDGSITISQRTKINNMLSRFGMLDAKCANTPMETNFPKVDNKNDAMLEDKTSYREGIGTLLYLSNTTRPDISTATGILARRVENPRSSDMTAMKRVMQYLKKNIDLKIVFAGGSSKDLVVYADADWASDLEDRKSTSGLVVQYGGSLIAWGSKKQSCVSLSSTEAEFVSAGLAAQEVLWIKGLLNDFDHKIEDPVTIREDNQGCIALTISEKGSARTKHMDVRLQFLRDLQKEGVIALEYCPSDDMLADFFTKPLAAPKFYDFMVKLGLDWNIC